MATIPIIPVPAGSGTDTARPALRQSPPLALYIHVPWCVRKCPYCDFNSHEAKKVLPEADFVEAVVSDLELALPAVWGRPLVSIFFGGGTPSLLSGEAVDQILAAVRARLPPLPGAEVTVEANPGTAEAAKFAGFRAAGVTRLSLGIQSFDDDRLRVLGRIHDANEARRAAELAGEHFETFNLDLIYGLAEQDVAGALRDIEAALDCRPTHLSCYQLTLEPNTLFARRPPAGLPDGDRCADMQEAIEGRLAAAGFAHYETSAFARAGFACRHNLNYWEFGDYLGIGPGAHSKLTSHDRIVRQMRWKHPDAWFANVRRGTPCQQDVVVEPEDLPFEFLMNALRLTQGFDKALFEQRTGLPLTTIAGELRRAVDDGLLELLPARVVPTRQGQRFLNVLLERFLRDAAV